MFLTKLTGAMVLILTCARVVRSEPLPCCSITKETL
jgi:hypothetical protein